MHGWERHPRRDRCWKNYSKYRKRVMSRPTASPLYTAVLEIRIKCLSGSIKNMKNVARTWFFSKWSHGLTAFVLTRDSLTCSATLGLRIKTDAKRTLADRASGV